MKKKPSTDDACGSLPPETRDEVCRALMDSSPYPIYILAADGAIVHATAPAVEAIGGSAAEVRRMNIGDLASPAAVPRLPGRISEVLREGSASFESEHKRRDGSFFPVAIRASAIKHAGKPAILADARDITARKLAENEVKKLTAELAARADRCSAELMLEIEKHKKTEEELRFKNAILATQQENSLDGILIVDKAQKIIGFNRRFTEMWDIPQSILDSRSDRLALLSILSKVENPEDFLTLVQHLYDLKDKKSRDIIFLKDGRVFDRYSSGMVGPAGEYYGRVWYFRDITEQKQAEDKIRKLNDRLRRTVSDLEASNKELESFTYSVSHDLRTPLRHIVSFVKYLDDEAGNTLQGEARHYLEVVSGSAKKMDALITSLLSFSKLSRAKPEMQEFSGLELAEEVAAEIRQDIRGREIEWKIGRVPNLVGDRAMLRQVFANLLDNAVKYTRDRKPARIEVFSREQGTETVIGVRDNGVGFNMQLYPGLFGVFRRLHEDSDFEGTGIGLANVKSVVTKHGGRVWAESAPDKETVFYFSLPAAGLGNKKDSESRGPEGGA